MTEPQHILSLASALGLGIAGALLSISGLAWVGCGCIAGAIVLLFFIIKSNQEIQRDTDPDENL